MMILGFPKMGVPPKWMFIREKPNKMDDLGGTPILGNLHLNDMADNSWVGKPIRGCCNQNCNSGSQLAKLVELPIVLYRFPHPHNNRMAGNPAIS